MSGLFNVSGRVAVVTGASAGLGRRAAVALVENGARVVGIARRAEALAALQAELGDAFTPLVADVAERAALPEIAAQAGAAYGAPEIVVHAAGINNRQVADEVTPEGWDETIALNLGAPFFLSQALVPGMKARGWGRIITFASLQSFRAFHGGLSYGASKGGIAQLTRAMAQAWSCHGITANALGPGFFRTELTAPVFADADLAARNAAQTCIGRNGEPEDMDGPLLFLCARASDYVTGQILMVDGGFTAK